MKHLLVIFFACISAQFIQAQNYLMPGTQSGAHASLGTAFIEGQTTIGAIPGYTFNGKTTVYFGFSYQKLNDFDLSSKTYSPAISYLVLDASTSNSPVSVELRGKYSFLSFSDSDVSLNNLSLGPIAHYPIQLSDNMSLIPGATIAWSRTTLKSSGSSQSNSGVSYGLLATFKINNFYIYPTFEFNEDDDLFSIFAGYIF